MDPQLDQIIESLLFASPEPIESKEIARLIRNVAKRQAAEQAEAEAAKAADAADAEYDESLDFDVELEEAERPADDEVAAEGPADDDPGDEDEEPAGGSDAGDDEEAADDDESESGSSAEDLGAPADLSKLSASQVDRAIDALNAYYGNTGRAFAVVARPNGWKLYSRPEFSPWLRELFPVKRNARLSPPALETLAIIAYRQPLTRAAIEAVRGVAVDGVVNTLVERGLIHIAGRADLPGRPLLYETTPLFFEHFNIRTIDDLPNAAELRQVQLPEPVSEAEGDEDDASETQEELDLEEASEPGDETAAAAPSDGVGTEVDNHGDDEGDDDEEDDDYDDEEEDDEEEDEDSEDSEDKK